MVQITRPTSFSTVIHSWKKTIESQYFPKPTIKTSLKFMFCCKPLILKITVAYQNLTCETNPKLNASGIWSSVVQLFVTNRILHFQTIRHLIKKMLLDHWISLKDQEFILMCHVSLESVESFKFSAHRLDVLKPSKYFLPFPHRSKDLVWLHE